MQSIVSTRQTIGAAVVLAGGFVLAAWLVAWGVSALTRAQQGSINITRAEYEAALSRWRVQAIDDYDLVLDVATPNGGRAGCLGCGTYSLSVHGRDVSLRSYISPTVGYAAQDDQAVIQRSYSVDGLFDEVDHILISGPRKCDRFPVTIIFDYTIRFDPQLGYPDFIGETSRDTSGIPASTLECGGGVDTEVKSLKVLHRGAKVSP